MRLQNCRRDLDDLEGHVHFVVMLVDQWDICQPLDDCRNLLDGPRGVCELLNDLALCGAISGGLDEFDDGVAQAFFGVFATGFFLWL